MKYWQNEVAGVTVCKMSEDFDRSPREEALEYICGKLTRCYKANYDDCDASWHLAMLIRPIVYRNMKDEYVGRAKCSSTDTWDADVGKKLARARCLQNYYADVINACMEVDWLFSGLSASNRLVTKRAINSCTHWVREAMGIEE